MDLSLLSHEPLSVNTSVDWNALPPRRTQQHLYRCIFEYIGIDSGPICNSNLLVILVMMFVHSWGDIGIYSFISHMYIHTCKRIYISKGKDNQKHTHIYIYIEIKGDKFL